MLPAKCKWLHFSWATLYMMFRNNCVNGIIVADCVIRQLQYCDEFDMVCVCGLECVGVCSTIERKPLIGKT